MLLLRRPLPTAPEGRTRRQGVRLESVMKARYRATRWRHTGKGIAERNSSAARSSGVSSSRHPPLSGWKHEKTGRKTFQAAQWTALGPHEVHTMWHFSNTLSPINRVVFPSVYLDVRMGTAKATSLIPLFPGMEHHRPRPHPLLAARAIPLHSKPPRAALFRRSREL